MHSPLEKQRKSAQSKAIGALGLGCAIWLLSGCEQRSASVWLLAGELDSLGVRLGPGGFADDTIPTIVAIGRDELRPETNVFYARADGALEARGARPGPADRLILPRHGEASFAFDAPSLAWVARRADGAWDLTVVPEHLSGTRIEGVYDWWWRPGWPEGRIEIDLAEGAAWIDLVSAESGWLSSGAPIGVIGRDAAARTLYLEGDRLRALDAAGSVSAESEPGVLGAAWMPGAVVFDTASGIYAWSDPALRPFLLDAAGCAGAIASPCDAERVLAGTCGAHAYARFAAIVWESPCGSGEMVASARAGDAPAAIGRSVIALEQLEDGRSIVVRGAAGAAFGEAWILDGSGARSLGVEVSALDPIVVRDGWTVIVAGDPRAGNAQLFELEADGVLSLLAERVREPGATEWLERWDTASRTGTLVRVDPETGARTTIAEGVPAGGHRARARWRGETIAITGADASGAGTLRVLDQSDGTVRQTLDTAVTAFVEIPLSPQRGVAYLRRGAEAGVHWRPLE